MKAKNHKSNSWFSNLKLSILLGIGLSTFGCQTHPTAVEKSSIDKVQLGEKLFFDKRFSADQTISCASCHEPSKYFTDQKRISKGVFQREGNRNAPSLLNVHSLPVLNWDGGVNSIETQMLVPISDLREMNTSIPKIITLLKNDSAYVSAFNSVWEEEGITAFTFTRTLGAYIRSLQSNQSKFDLYLRGEVEMTDEELLGRDLFFSERTKCSVCHEPPHFTNNQLMNNGIHETYIDSGKARVTFKHEDLYFFKVPSLRNVEHTFPYMHDGSFQTLEEVVEHYNLGGKKHPKQSPLIQPLSLTNEEQNALVKFLQSLTDLTVVDSIQ